jgi:ketosteroid isomerase-like protein
MTQHDRLEQDMTDSPEANRQIVLRLMKALEASDVDALRELMAPEATWWVLGVGTMDRETLIAQSTAMLGTAKVAQTTILGTTAEDDRVAVESRGNFEFEDGRVYRNAYHQLFVVRDGKVRAVREYLDLAVTERVFGAVA